MKPTEIEEEIVAKELDAPRVELAHINSLVKQLTFETVVIPNTTTTVVYAMLDGFSVASGESACISASNYDAELGERIAKNRALDNATSELWRLEGYRLFRSVWRYE